MPGTKNTLKAKVTVFVLWKNHSKHMEHPN